MWDYKLIMALQQVCFIYFLFDGYRREMTNKIVVKPLRQWCVVVDGLGDCEQHAAPGVV